jgi:hypothetical protein
LPFFTCIKFLNTVLSLQANMSATNMSPSNESVENNVKVNKTLLNLYNKNNLFGFFLLKYVNEELHVFENDEAIVRQLLVFEDSEKQIDFALQFKNSIPDIKKNIRKTITAHKRALKKAEKPKKEKVVRPKKVSEKPKKEKKTKKVSSDDQLVDELVSLANDMTISDNKKEDAIAAVNQHIANLPPVVQEKQHTTPILEKPQKNTKKSKKEEVVVEEPKKTKKTKKDEVVVEEPKKNTKKSKKEEVVTEEPKKTKKSKKDVKEPEGTKVSLKETPVEDDDELAVSVFEFMGKQYLIDDNSTVYDFVSHDEIGSFVDGNIILH